MFLDNLGKVAACSVVLVGLSFCAGYFSLKGYLDSLGAYWFLGFYAATEFIVGGMWYASFLFMAMVLTLLFANLNWPSHLELRRASFVLMVLFILASMALVICLGDREAMKYLGGGWSFSLITIISAINISISVHEKSGGTPYYRFLGLVSGAIFILVMIVIIPLLNGQSSAQLLRNKDARVMSYVYKVDGEKTHILVSVGGGKMLLVDADMITFSVVDPATVWGVR
ncbi:hypothetical protein [Pseudomonas sp. NPDC086278]|uniref:hypothetical protein n=1 Tax=Pseudomonas sp. NPDC086278 TaxID=3390646 RepID=UPI003D0200FB